MFLHADSRSAREFASSRIVGEQARSSPAIDRAGGRKRSNPPGCGGTAVASRSARDHPAGCRSSMPAPLRKAGSDAALD